MLFSRKSVQFNWNHTDERAAERRGSPRNQSHGAYNFSTQNKGIDLLMISFSLRAKHPTKVHVWAGISKKGPTQICIFDGIMKAPLYVNILERTLLPFIARVMPTSHRFMADNDPKHTSRLAQNFLQEKKINWWRTPAESPDLNPIENLWHELKEYMRREVKPKTKQELIDGIHMFWNTLTVAKCRKYIGHLRKVIPKVLEVGGAATGY